MFMVVVNPAFALLPVCLGLIWDSDQPLVDDIMAVVNNIGLTMHLSDVCTHLNTSNSCKT